MTFDSSNSDTDVAERLPTLRVRSKQRRAWGLDGESEPVLGPLGIAWSGILFAAGYFPVVISGFTIVWWLWTDGFRDFSIANAIATFGLLIFSFVIGVLYAIFMSIPAFYLTQGLRWGLQGAISGRGASGIYGGLTGFLCTTGGGLFLIGGMPPGYNWTRFILASLLAVVMGHVGAVWTGYQKREEGFPFFEPIFSVKKQITISFLMKLTLVVAVSTAVLKTTGETGFRIGIAWLAYLVAQTLLLVCDHWITCRLKSR